MAKSIIVNKKQYFMPEVSKNTYFKYLEIFNKLMEKDSKGGMYNYSDYEAMADAIAMVYKYEFTAKDILEDDDILIEDIITNFMYVEIAKNQRVDKTLTKYRTAFQNGKGKKKK